MQKTKVKKIKAKLSTRSLPKITHRAENGSSIEYPINHISYSGMCKFSSNPLLFRIQYVNKDVIETSHGAAAVLGNAFHTAIDMYFTSKGDAVADGLKAGMEFIDKYPEGFINWTHNIPDRQTMLEKFAFAYGNRVKELKNDGSLVSSEQMIEEYVDVEWRGQKVSLPVKLKGFLDRLFRDEENRLVIEDDKICAMFSNPEKIDGRKILQAIQYYFLVFAFYKEAPYKIRFVESKHTKSKDGVQTKAYEIIYSENELFFDFYMRFYGDIMKALLGEQVFVPNIDTFMDNEVGIIAYIHRLDLPDELARQQKKLKVDSITEILKKKITSVKNMNALKSAIERSLVEYKSINYEKMETQEKISTKLMEHGIVLHFDSKVEGNSFVQYRFIPSIGVKMSSLHGFTADIEQAIGMSGVRIVAPIPDTSFVGIETPKIERNFVALTKGIIAKKETGLPIGLDQNGNIIRLTLDEMPHMLVAGATGSGKSMFLNVIIKSLIGQGEASLRLIDPKMVEFAQFEDDVDEIVNETDQAYNLLAILVSEMQRRYTVMKSKKARSYKECDLEPIVCVIDEFADLIMSARKTSVEGEDNIEKLMVRLAQKGRAAGIHLIIATQRPDSKVITGLIKANFPTKVAFATSSESNSRIILDESGAEKLLGRGDGLIANPKFTGLKRFQGYSF